MENGKCQEDTPKELSEVPPLIQYISSVQVAGFDSIEECNEEIEPPNNPSTLRIVSSYAIHVHFSEESYETNGF